MLSSNFATHFESLLNATTMEPAHKTLFSMLGLGTYGPFAGVWSSIFKELACLHLLVLSGSQVGALAFWLKRAHWMLWPSNSNVGLRLWSAFAMTGGVLVFYADQVKWSAPITRATFCYLLANFPLRLRPRWIFLGAFALQGAIFPEHFKEISVYLSWVCFLILALVETLTKNLWGQKILATTACLMIAQLAFFEGTLSAGYFLTGLVANLCLALIFEYFIQSLLSMTLLIALAKLLIPFELIHGLFDQIWGFLSAPFFKSAVSILLVALKSIRYID